MLTVLVALIALVVVGPVYLWIVIAVSDGLRDTDSWLVNKGCLLLWIFGAFLVPVLALLLYVLSILLA